MFEYITGFETGRAFSYFQINIQRIMWKVELLIQIWWHLSHFVCGCTWIAFIYCNPNLPTNILYLLHWWIIEYAHLRFVGLYHLQERLHIIMMGVCMKYVHNTGSLCIIKCLSLLNLTLVLNFVMLSFFSFLLGF